MLTKDKIEKLVEDMDLEKIQAKHHAVVLTRAHFRSLLRLALCACSTGEFMGAMARATSKPSETPLTDVTAMAIGFAQAMAELFPHPDELANAVQHASELMGAKIDVQIIYGTPSEKVH